MCGITTPFISDTALVTSYQPAAQWPTIVLPASNYAVTCTIPHFTHISDPSTAQGQ